MILLRIVILAGSLEPSETIGHYKAGGFLKESVIVRLLLRLPVILCGWKG